MPDVKPQFTVMPAIDLRDGRAVRLRRGDFDQETVFGYDPAAVAAQFARAGAAWIHVVDLDGARSGRPEQHEAIAAVVAAAGEGAACEVAGGLRDELAVGQALAAGARRVVLGTAALRDAAFARRMVDVHGPARIVAALDVRDGHAVGEAWRPGVEGVPAGEVLDRLADAGIEVFEVTAIQRDGELGGPDLDLLAGLVGLGRGRIVASGGIASVGDLLATHAIGCVGAIVGRSIYDGSLDLATAIRAMAGPPAVR